MRRTLPRRLSALAVVVLSSASVFLAAPPQSEGPQRFVVPSLDGAPITVESPVNGRGVSAWMFRSGPQFDIAVSVRDESGAWSRPSFFGQFDGVDQRSPALAVDEAGHVYLAYAASDSGRIFVSALAVGTTSWTAPVAITPDGLRATAPTLLVVGNRLVVAFRVGSRVGMAQVSLLADPSRPLGIQDGPDPVGGHGSNGAPTGHDPLGGGS